MTKISVYADGGVILKNPSAIGGTYAYILMDGAFVVAKHSGVLTPDMGLEGVVSNNVSELYALCAAIQSAPDVRGFTAHQYHFYSDSYITLLRVFRGAKLNGIPPHLALMLGEVRRMLKYFDFQWTLLDGHPTREQLAAGIGKRGSPCSEWNVWCDKQCNEEGRKYRAQLAEREAAA